MLLFWPMFIFRGRRETFDSFLSPERRSGWQDRTLFHPCGRSGTCCTLLKRWQAWVDMKSAFRSSFLRQAQDDVWKGLKVSLCETVVVFELVHDDYAWQAQFFGCLRIMFRGRRSASETATNKCLIPTFSHLQWWSCFVVCAAFSENVTHARATLSSLCVCRFARVVAQCSFWDRSGDPRAVLVFRSSRNPLVTLRVSVRSRCGAVLVLRSLGQPSRHFGCVRSLSLWCGACFQNARAILSALWACQIAVVVARQDLCTRSV